MYHIYREYSCFLSLYPLSLIFGFWIRVPNHATYANLFNPSDTVATIQSMTAALAMTALPPPLAVSMAETTGKSSLVTMCRPGSMWHCTSGGWYDVGRRAPRRRVLCWGTIRK